MILHQELFRLFLPDLGNAGLLQTIKVLKHRHLDLPVNDKADLKRRFHTEHPHFSVLIHLRLHAYLCKLRKNLMVHSLLRSLALRPPLKRQGSLYPVCFSLPCIIKSKQLKFSLKPYTVFLQPGIKFPQVYLRPQKRLYVFLRSLQRRLLPDPENIPFRRKCA